MEVVLAVHEYAGSSRFSARDSKQRCPHTRSRGRQLAKTVQVAHFAKGNPRHCQSVRLAAKASSTGTRPIMRAV
eukprot:10374526-Alexandrium_andersonii.AAC.1